MEGYSSTQKNFIPPEEQKDFSASPDVAMSSGFFNGVSVRVNRPEEGAMYGISFCKKAENSETEELDEVAMIGGSTEEAQTVYKKAVALLESGKTPEEVAEIIKQNIVDLHGGSAN